MDELSWSDLLLGIVIYAAVHAIVTDLTTRLMSKVFGDDEEGPREAIDDMRKEVSGLRSALVDMASALNRLGLKPDDEEKKTTPARRGRK